jgi:hypothetical protein
LGYNRAARFGGLPFSKGGVVDEAVSAFSQVIAGVSNGWQAIIVLAIAYLLVTRSDKLEAERTKVRKLERDQQMDKHEARMDKHEARTDRLEKTVGDHISNEGQIWDFTRAEFGKMQSKMHDMDVNIQSIKVLIEDQNKRRDAK